SVAVLGELAHDLVVRGEDEVRELDLGHGDEPVEGHADRAADDAALRERRVDDTIVAELVEEPLGDAEDAAGLAPVPAHPDHAAVAPHLVAERVVDRLDHVHLSHALISPRSPQCPLARGALRSASRCSTRCHGRSANTSSKSESTAGGGVLSAAAIAALISASISASISLSRASLQPRGRSMYRRSRPTRSARLHRPSHSPGGASLGGDALEQAEP